METYEEFFVRTQNHIRSWPFTSSFAPALTISGIYYFVSLKLGPKFMENRKPYKLKNVLMVYNFIQVVYNLWMVWKIDTFRFFPYLYHYCTTNEPDIAYEKSLLDIGWWWCMNKILDLSDTIFMILKKKYSQINVLHLYHHPSTLLFAIFQLHYGPGLLYMFAWYLNSWVHILMYFYYFMAALGPRYEKFLWWKKYLTSLQIVQLVSFLFYIVFVYTFCSNCPIKLLVVYTLNALILVGFFANFYLKTYKRKIR